MTEAPKSALCLEHVRHRYGEVVAVDDVSLSIAPGELVCLLGPSGCGKTTVLRIAAGLEPLQQGRVLIDGVPVADAERDVPPEDRNVGLVFQDYALFPHLNVRDNVAFGLTGVAPGERRDRVHRVLAKVGMTDQANAYPDSLSGGQQQRVALARALAPEPRIVLLDEPFSGLDLQLRNQVRDQTLHVLKESGAATLMVTHDPEEAMFMADRIALMRAGRIAQVGPPAELYFNPRNAFVAAFFGDLNRFAGTVRDGRVDTPLGTVAADGLAEGAAVEVLIRPEALRLHPATAHDGEGAVARVMAARMLGRSSLIHLSVPQPAGGELHLHARIPGRFLPQDEQLLEIHLDRSQTFVFPAR